MSGNIYLSLRIKRLSSISEADTVEVAVRKVFEKHWIDSWMEVSVFHEPPWVKAVSEPFPIVVNRFGPWSSEVFERDVTEAVLGVAPSADIDRVLG